ncbi:MAG: spore coat associated protein CotJA [Clostridia bacterium]|nr:spore coat associated protein CotJA [Clostridia bacterium]MBQ7089677.1 spore coat associated protein CotJA [Clostridia bacterium]
MDDFNLRDMLAPPLRYRAEPPMQAEAHHHRAPSEQRLAMGYVPVQVWRELYEPSEGFPRGTIFKELDLPFKGGAER